MSDNDDDRIMEDAVRIMGDTVGTEGFTPNCCVLSWRLRLYMRSYMPPSRRT